MPCVTTEIADAVATLTLDHERRRNALGRALVEEATAALAAFREAKARAVILRARAGATRWAGTTRCAGWCARSRATPGR